MGKSAPVGVSVHAPETDTGRRTLAGQMTGVWADHVLEVISRLNCPAEQKLALLDAVIRSVKEEIPSKQTGGSCKTGSFMLP